MLNPTRDPQNVNFFAIVAFHAFNVSCHNISSIVIGQDNVPVVSCARNLGVLFDNNLNMSHHINKTCQSVVYHLHNIRRIRKFLSYEDRKSVVQALIMSRIDYCNSLLFGVTDVHLSKLQRLQNTAARLICSIPKHDHITPTLIKLHWLPVRLRIKFKIAMLAFKCIHQYAPLYLVNLLKVRNTSCYSLRSNEGTLLEDYSTKTKKTLGDRAFVTSAPKIWNELPMYIRNLHNFSIFKKLVKTYYFEEAFNVNTSCNI